VRRQRALLAGVARDYRPLGPDAGGWIGTRLRPAQSCAFSLRTTPEDAVTRIVAALDELDTGWRKYLKVWDGFPHGLDSEVRGWPRLPIWTSTGSR
jgi:hypothetical protein